MSFFFEVLWLQMFWWNRGLRVHSTDKFIFPLSFKELWIIIQLLNSVYICSYTANTCALWNLIGKIKCPLILRVVFILFHILLHFGVLTHFKFNVVHIYSILRLVLNVHIWLKIGIELKLQRNKPQIFSYKKIL